MFGRLLRSKVRNTQTNRAGSDQQINNALSLLIFDTEGKLNNLSQTQADPTRNLIESIKALIKSHTLTIQFLGQQYIRLVVLINSILNQGSSLKPATTFFKHLQNLALAIDPVCIEENTIEVLNYIQFEHDIPLHLFGDIIAVLQNGNSLSTYQTLAYIKYSNRYSLLEKNYYDNNSKNIAERLVIEYISEWLTTPRTAHDYEKLANWLEQFNLNNNIEFVTNSVLENDVLELALSQLSAAFKFYDGNLAEFNKGTLVAYNILQHVREIVSNNIYFPMHMLIKVLKSVRLFIENPLHTEPLYIPENISATKLGLLLNELKRSNDYQELVPHIPATLNRLCIPLKGVSNILQDLRYGRGVTFNGHSFTLSPEYKKRKDESEESLINMLIAFFNRIYFDNQNVIYAKIAVDKFLNLYTQIGIVPELMDRLGNCRSKNMRDSSIDFHVNEQAKILLTITEVTGISNNEDIKVPGTIKTIVKFDERYPTLHSIVPSNPCLKLLYTNANCERILQSPQGQKALITAYQTELRETIGIIENVPHNSNLKPAAKRIAEQLQHLAPMKNPLNVRLISIIKLCFIYPGNITWLAKLDHLSKEIANPEMSKVICAYLKLYGFPLCHHEIDLLINAQRALAELVNRSHIECLGAVSIEDLHSAIRFKLYLLKRLDQSYDDYILNPSVDLFVYINAIENELNCLPPIPWIDYIQNLPYPNDTQVAGEQDKLNEDYQPIHLVIQDYIYALRQNNLCKFFGITTFIYLKYEKSYKKEIDRELLDTLLGAELSNIELEEDDLHNLQTLSLLDLSAADKSVLASVFNAVITVRSKASAQFYIIDSNEEIDEIPLTWSYFERVLTLHLSDEIDENNPLLLIVQNLLNLTGHEIVQREFNLLSYKYRYQYEIIAKLERIKEHFSLSTENSSLRDNPMQGTQLVAKLPLQAASLIVNAFAHPVQKVISSGRLVTPQQTLSNPKPPF